MIFIHRLEAVKSLAKEPVTTETCGRGREGENPEWRNSEWENSGSPRPSPFPQPTNCARTQMLTTPKSLLCRRWFPRHSVGTSADVSKSKELAWTMVAVVLGVVRSKVEVGRRRRKGSQCMDPIIALNPKCFAYFHEDLSIFRSSMDESMRLAAFQGVNLLIYLMRIQSSRERLGWIPIDNSVAICFL